MVALKLGDNDSFILKAIEKAKEENESIIALNKRARQISSL